MAEHEAPLRVGVIGAGIMGTNHARVARNLHGAKLTAVVDADVARARAAAGPSGAIAVTSVDEVIGALDVAVVAVPTAFHVATALQLIEAGIHVLVEKPIAPDVAEAQRLIDAAEAAGIVLAVGHIERFNAAVAELPKYLDRPIHLEARRVSPYSARVPDGVVFDLMIHDIDIVLSLVGRDTEVEHVCGVSRVIKGKTEDVASAEVRFSNGLTASFVTSRLGQAKVRSLEITQEESVVQADLVRQDITIHRMTHHEYLSDEGTRYRQSSVVEIPFLETRGEPLALELQHLIDVVRSGGAPRVSGRDGQRALDLATRITEAVRS